MTNEEIIRDYKQAAAPVKQIGILADLNQCSRQDIVKILREAGCELPKLYDKKKVETPEPELAVENPNSLDPREVMNDILEVSRENRKLKSIIIKMLEERYGEN